MRVLYDSNSLIGDQSYFNAGNPTYFLLEVADLIEIEPNGWG